MSYFSNFQTIPYDLNGDGVYDNITDLSSFVVASESLLNNQTFYNYIQIQEGEKIEQLSQRLYGTPEYYWVFLVINLNIKNVWNDWPKGNTQLLDYVNYSHNDFIPYVAIGASSLLNKFIIGETVQGVLSNAYGEVLSIHTNDNYITIKPTSGTFRAEGEDIFGMNSQDAFTANEILPIAYAPEYYIDDSTGDITAPRLAGTHKITKLEHLEYLNDKNKYIKGVKPDKIDEFVAEFHREIG